MFLKIGVKNSIVCYDDIINPMFPCNRSEEKLESNCSVLN